MKPNRRELFAKAQNSILAVRKNHFDRDTRVSLALNGIRLTYSKAAMAENNLREKADLYAEMDSVINDVLAIAFED